MPPRCTRCTITAVLDDLACYDGRLSEIDARLRPHQSLAFRLRNTAKGFEFHSHPAAVPGESYGATRDLEIPSDLVTMWQCTKKLWQIQSTKFWFELDLGELEFAVSVFQVCHPSQLRHQRVRAGQESVGTDESPGSFYFNIFGRE
jgi:hypothetical protein